jgi:hypothetical protein
MWPKRWNENGHRCAKAMPGVRRQYCLQRNGVLPGTPHLFTVGNKCKASVLTFLDMHGVKKYARKIQKQHVSARCTPVTQSA